MLAPWPSVCVLVWALGAPPVVCVAGVASCCCEGRWRPGPLPSLAALSLGGLSGCAICMLRARLRGRGGPALSVPLACMPCWGLRGAGVVGGDPWGAGRPPSPVPRDLGQGSPVRVPRARLLWAWRFSTGPSACRPGEGRHLTPDAPHDSGGPSPPGDGPPSPPRRVDPHRARKSPEQCWALAPAQPRPQPGTRGGRAAESGRPSQRRQRPWVCKPTPTAPGTHRSRNPGRPPLKGRAAGGGTAPDARRPSQRWKATPLGWPPTTPKARSPPRGNQARGTVLGPHTRHAGSGPGDGHRLNPDASRNITRRTPGGALPPPPQHATTARKGTSPVLWGGRPRLCDPCVPGAVGVGVGTHYRSRSVRSCESLLRAVGVAGGRPRGGCPSPS